MKLNQSSVQRILLAALSVWPYARAQAQHPVEVERETASGDYMAALVTFEKMPKRISTGAAELAAAKSAWALSLPAQAIEHFDQAIKSGQLDDVDLARVYLGKGIIQFQEGQPQIAILEAKKALALLKNPSPLRAQVRALWGQSLAAMSSYAPAEEQYLLAAKEAAPDDVAEFAFLTAQTQYKLGKYGEAQQNLELIPLRHARASEGVRLLSQMAVERGNLKVAAFWLKRGRKDFSDQFLDSWVDFILVRAAISNGDIEEMRSLRVEAEKRFPPSDPWIALMSAAAEEYEWSRASARPSGTKGEA